MFMCIYIYIDDKIYAIYMFIHIQIHMYIYIYICHFFVKHLVFGQCQWDTACRSRTELSNAIVKSHFRLTRAKIWPLPFCEGVILYGDLAKGGWGEQGNRAVGTEGGRGEEPAH